MHDTWLVDQLPKTFFLQFTCNTPLNSFKNSLITQALLLSLNLQKKERKLNIFSGDMIPKEDVFKLLEQLAGEEDEDGFIPYVPFIDKLCGKA